MKAIFLEIADFLRKRPAWFVTSAWLLLLLTAFICFATFVGGAARYYASLPPQHHWANYDRAAVHLLFFAFWVALLTAIASSVSLGFGFRTAASALVATVWICLIAGGTLRLALVEEGPEQFLEYSGQQKFLVPWRYIPQESDSSSLSGFYVFLCPDSLLGEYDEGCHTAMQRIAIRPAHAGFEYFWEEKSIWKFSKIEMKPAGARDGYQVSVGTTAAQRHQIQAIFFERPDSAGSTHCLVICVFGSCRRQALIGNNILSYDASYLLSETTFVEWDWLEQKLAPPEATFGDWDAIDQRLARLVSSWIVYK